MSAPGRVQNIKKHFENAPESPYYQGGQLLSKAGNGHLPASAQTAIKRSPAFRNDKVVPKKQPLPTPRAGFLGSTAAANKARPIYGTAEPFRLPAVNAPQLQKKTPPGPQRVVKAGSESPTKLSPTQRVHVLGMTPVTTKNPRPNDPSKLVKVFPVKVPKPTTTPAPKMTTFSAAPKEDTKVAEILKSPLPQGPPPQKPPRTFAHKLQFFQQAPEPKVTKRPPSRSASGPLRPATVRRPSVPPPSMPARSKTESQIVRRKDRPGRSPVQQCPVPQYAQADRSVELARSHSMEHVYAVPFVPKPEDGVPVTDKVRRSPGKDMDGLYYMARKRLRATAIFKILESTPIQWPSRPTNLPVQSFKPQQRGAKTSPPCAKVMPTLRESPKMIIEPPFDQDRIQMLVNEAFNSVQLVTPDPSTDSEDPLDSDFSYMDRSSPSEDDTDEEAKRLVEKRKGYVKRASSFAFPQTRRFSADPTANHLFECVLLVGLNLDQNTKGYQPYIKSKFPANAQVPDEIKLFVFPDASDWPPHEGSEHKKQYSIVLTSDSGARSYGYCQRIVPEGMDLCLPLAYCIVTKHRASGFFYKILAELESRHGQTEASRISLLSALQYEQLPPLGSSLRIPGLSVSRPMDQRLEDTDLSTLYSSLPDRMILRVVASVLHERQVVLLSASLSKLTACVMGLQAALEPFQWQHTLVAALPANMTEICNAPTPYVIGLLKSKSGQIPAFSIEEGMAIDLDTGKAIKCLGDECKILPVRLQKALFKVLQLASSTGENEPTRNVLVSEAFIRLFVEACGHYRNHIVMQQDGKTVFERESFSKAVESRSLQLFLEWFAETSLFCTFIDDRTRKSSFNSIFDARVLQNFKESDENLVQIIKNRKAINKKVKTLGNRIRDLVH
ncbi:DENN domain-containing protein 2B-like isoform X3 [Cloeon dipterum]|uniref:DENN domain-containing protein 2B-like isoform X3 n=1 Tax=Cloeon dipterum TaxID=197152 RepID=UPI0032203AFB